MNTYQTTPQVKRITNTRKRSFFLSTRTHVAPVSGWSGGSRDYTSGLNYVTNSDYHFQQGNQFSKLSVEQEIPKDTLVIQTGVFCGKPSTPHIMCRPDELEIVKAYLGVT